VTCVNTRATGEPQVTGADLAALQALTRASTEMTLGEMRQLGVTEPLKFTEGEYYDLIRSKTASLMRTACELGALAGARSHEKVLGEFGENLGIAFQITDDLLDYREVKETTGKPSGLDLREHKVTLPLIWPGLVAAALFSFVASFGHLEISLLLVTPGQTTLPTAILHSLQRKIDPTISAVSAIQLAAIRCGRC